MSAPGGWIRIERRLFEDDYLLAGRYAGSAFKGAWVDLIAMATHRPYNGLARGEVRASQRFLQHRWGWGASRVNTFIRTLEAEGMIERRTERKWKREQHVIMICNYDRYQTNQNTDGTGSAMVSEQGPENTETTPLAAGQKGSIEASRSRSRSPTVTGSGTKTRKNKKEEHLTDTDTSLPDGRDVSAGQLVPVERYEVEVVRPTPQEPYYENGTIPEGHAVASIVKWWVDHRESNPTDQEAKRQAGIVRRMIRQHGPYETAEAYMGMSYLYAYREGIFDAFDVERNFSKARQAHAQNAGVDLGAAVDWTWLFGKADTSQGELL